MQCPKYATSFMRKLSRRSINTKLECSGFSLEHGLHISTRWLRPSFPPATRHFHSQIELLKIRTEFRVPFHPASDGHLLHRHLPFGLRKYSFVHTNTQDDQVEPINVRAQSRDTQLPSSSKTNQRHPPNVNKSVGKKLHTLGSGHGPELVNVEPLGSGIPTSTLTARRLPFLNKPNDESNNIIRISSKSGDLSGGIDGKSQGHHPGKSSITGIRETQISQIPRESWQIQKKSLLKKFGPSGWTPRKRLSPDALEGIRALHSQYPDKYTTPVLAEQFKVSPEAVRRIIKSKWRANEEEEESRRQRWDRRGAAIWGQMVEIGIKPPKKWRDMGVGRNKKRPVATNERHRFSEMKHRFGDISNYREVRDVSQNGHEVPQEISLSDRIL